MRLPNLLPQEYKNSYKIYLGLLYARRLLYVQVGLAAVLLAVLGAQHIFLTNKLTEAKNSLSALKSNQQEVSITELQAAANREADRLAAVKEILKVQTEPSLYLDELVAKIPVGVTLDSVAVDLAGAKMTVTGRAVRRDLVVNLQASLENSKAFEVSRAPLSNLTSAQDASFYFELTLKK